MMDQEEIQENLQKAGTMRRGRPYQYKLNRKKRKIAEREGLESEEEEVQDLRVVENIEEILRATYEIKTRGARSNEEAGTPVQIRNSVEPTTPCTISTSTKKRKFREQVTDGQRNIGE